VLRGIFRPSSSPNFIRRIPRPLEGLLKNERRVRPLLIIAGECDRLRGRAARRSAYPGSPERPTGLTLCHPSGMKLRPPMSIRPPFRKGEFFNSALRGGLKGLTSIIRRSLNNELRCDSLDGASPVPDPFVITA
jgi:hypothetical protein